MEAYVIILIFILGAIIGSFLNVIIFRYHTGRGLGGRSVCLSCARTLHFLELIPVISFLLQRGRCASCKSRISPIYPIVEFISGLFFVLIALHEWTHFGYELSIPFFVTVIFYWSVWSILLMIAVYDLRLKIIPSEPVYTFIILAIIPKIIETSAQGLGVLPIFYQLGAGLLLSLPFVLLWLFSRGRLMGLGDAKLALGLGFLFGLDRGLTTLLISFWIGAILSIFLVLIGKFKMKSEIPFAPFLVIAAFLVYIFNLDLLFLANFFSF